MKKNPVSRRSFVKMSTASLAALSMSELVSAQSEAPQQQQRPERQPADPIVAQPGNADAFTRYYFDSLMFESRYLDSDIPSTKLELFGETFDTPIMTAALSHLRVPNGNGLVVYAQAAKACNAVHWFGMGEDKDLEDIIATGARTIKVITEIFRRIKHAVNAGCFAIGMDIDHSFDFKGNYDNVMGLPMKAKTAAEIKSFVKAAGNKPFIVKGVLSVSDAKKCLQAGCAGIVISHHGGHLKYSVPPLMVIEDIVDAVGGKMKIFVDCGITSGFDAYKCMALGADAVSVGRHLMPLLRDGADAVAKRMKEMTSELAGVMTATGVHNLGEFDPTVIHRVL